MTKTVLITGAGGFVGGHLVRHFQERGWTVRAMVRRPETMKPAPGVEVFRFDLDEGPDGKPFEGSVDALIHCTYAMDARDPASTARRNIEGARRLLKMSRERGVGRFVFLSSLAAHEGAASYYGRSKWEIEKMLDPKRDLVIRPGLVAGDGGLFQRIRESLRKTRVVPLFFGGRQRIQTVWIGDLCRAVEEGIRKGLTGSYAVAEKDGVPIREFYSRTAGLDNVRCLFLPLPGSPVLWLLRLLERWGLNLPVTSENLLGLKAMKVFPVEEDLKKLEIGVRGFQESLMRL